MKTYVVRADQHGTETGYTYGCRCSDCRKAHANYYHEHDLISAEAMERVYQALEREADMDGLVTATSDRLGELSGLSRQGAFLGVRALLKLGRIEEVGHVGRGGIHHVQLVEAS